MKRFVTAVGLCVLAFSAQSQSGSSVDQVVVPANKAISGVYMSPDEFKAYKGSYSLSNGKTLHLNRRGTQMFAQVDDQSEHRIVNYGAGSFRAPDGKMAIDLAVDSDWVSGKLEYIDEAKPSVAGASPVWTSATLASR